MQEMTPQQYRSFLRYGTRTAKLATVRADGRPHVVPVWFVLDGDDLVFNTGVDSLKGKALGRDDRVCLCVDDETPPYAFVMIEGRVSVSNDPAEVLTWATRIGGRYMGEHRAEEYGNRNTAPGEFVVRITPTHIVARTDIAA